MDTEKDADELSDSCELKDEKANITNGYKTNGVWSPEALQRLLADAITYKSSLEDIKTIIHCGARVNARVKKGLRPLHYAAFVNYLDCVKLLVEKGADVNLTDDIGYTPLHLCARKGFFETMKILVENGAILNYCEADDNGSENTKALGYLTLEPLNMAIDNNHIDCVQLLLENGARPDNKYFMGYEVNLVPLDNLQCMELLLQHGADPNSFNRCGLSPLMKACREKKINAVKLLIEYGADVNLQCPPRFDQKRAIHFATLSGDLSIVETLLQHEASTTKPDGYKYSPLHESVLRDRYDICELLLKYGCDVDEETENYSTSLMLACGTPGLKNRKSIVELLLRNGANVNAHSEYISYIDPYLSPLAEYLKNNSSDLDYDIILLLIKYGAKVSFRGYLQVVRMKDPFGLLHYMNNVFDRKDICMLLFQAACSYDIESIKHTEGLESKDRKLLITYGTSPRELKHLARINIRCRLKNDIPDKIATLPLPNLIKSYLLFEA